ncbi:hypothetical protein PR048_033468 [Dryococelus australis]|uniref:FP protein C-terminal domain-containing protein n=1 Tax=Dryococelus australis TaxID=614101 RepID=A0ABQ9G0C8_9NEOP|nr:hypothetical protein PR048_033468 [Dryococelus australis]
MWTKDCKIYIRKTESARTIRIANHDDAFKAMQEKGPPQTNVNQFMAILGEDLNKHNGETVVIGDMNINYC